MCKASGGKVSKTGARGKATSTTIAAAVQRLFESRTYITTAEVAAQAGITRQAAHSNLVKMAARGEIVQEGASRSTRYRRLASSEHIYEISDLDENEVCGNEKRVVSKLNPEILEIRNVVQILNFAFTEMVNNAIDHSRGTNVIVRWFLEPDRIAFEVEDNGVGAFATIREERNLADDFEALGELSKGKQTTDPDRHSGLGIFFTSRMVNRFVLSAGRISWVVDNEIDDVAWGWLDEPRIGTLVRCEIRFDTTIAPRDVYAELSNPATGRYDKTTIHVDLFKEHGGSFVSRTEAKAIGTHLEGFNEIELDFSGISEIGQGFADQLFRVWTRENPSSRLVPINANPAILAMITAMRSST
jgi:anti-sigma regulatory factor (Ser/Thr protein kinase)